MKRIAQAFLKQWKQSSERKPLVIRGARQVGKTWLMKEFGKNEYETVVYINFENDRTLSQLFDTNFDIERIIKTLEIYSGKVIQKEKTLIIFDEIQELPKAVTSLKYFYENAPEYHIIAAGSLLGVALNRNTSFPVGKIAFLDLYPLNFIEFLWATEEHSLVELIQQKNWEIIPHFKDKFTALLKTYFFTGGMPEAVNQYVKDKNVLKVRTIQKNILDAYEQDFSKHAPKEIVPRIRLLWNSLPSQLAKENKKFIYGIIKEGARAKEFEMALSWLEDSGLIHKVYNISRPAVPLKAYQDNKAFKIYILDVGLLCAMCELDIKLLLNPEGLFNEFNGYITEQYVLQQLKTTSIESVYYWSSETGKAEIDFIIQDGQNVIPIEVKANENLKAKSLKIYFEKYAPQKVFKFSLSDYREESWLTNVPLYALDVVNEVEL
jgi:predicted AAA+ superfamily ATPase